MGCSGLLVWLEVEFPVSGSSQKLFVGMQTTFLSFTALFPPIHATPPQSDLINFNPTMQTSRTRTPISGRPVVTAGSVCVGGEMKISEEEGSMARLGRKESYKMERIKTLVIDEP